MVKITTEQSIELIEENLKFVRSDMEFAEIISKTVEKSFGETSALTVNLAYKNKELFRYVSEQSRIYTNFDEIPEALYDASMVYVKPLEAWVRRYPAGTSEYVTKFRLGKHIIGKLTIIHNQDDEYFDIDPVQDKKLIDFLDMVVPKHIGTSVIIRIKL